MSRPLVWITIALLGGMAAGELACYVPLSVGIVLGTGLVATGLINRRHDRAAAPTLALFGLSAWLLWSCALTGLWLTGRLIAAAPQPSVEALIGRGPTTATGTVSGFIRRDPRRSVVTLTQVMLARPSAVSVDDQANSAVIRLHDRLRLTIRHGTAVDPPLLLPGDRVRVTTTLFRPRGLRNPGLFDAGRYLHRQGIGVVASASADRVVIMARNQGGPLQRLLRPFARWRLQLRKKMNDALSPQAAILLAAVILGDTQNVTPQMRETFVAGGVAHLLAISGTHLATLAVAVAWLVRLACRLLPGRWLLWLTRWLTPTQWALLAILPAALFYTLLAGGRLATVRALIMLVTFSGALLLGRPYDLLTSLAAAALIVVVWDPLAIGESSFQLSFAAVLGMALMLEAWSARRFHADTTMAALQQAPPAPPPVWLRWRDRLLCYLLVTMAAQIITAPLVLHHFRQLSWVGLISNLIVPWLGLLIIPLGLASCVGSIIWPTSPLPFASANSWLAERFVSLVGWFAGWPGAVVHLPSPSIFTLLVVYGLLAAGWWWRWRGLRRVAGIGLVCWLCLWAAEPFRPAERLRVCFLDVGQGDAAVIEFPSGPVMVVDGGPQYGSYDTGRAVVAPFLWDRGIDRIDYLVATHPQADHIGGQTTLVEQFAIGELWENGEEQTGTIATTWRAALRSRGIVARVIAADEAPVRIGGAEVDLLHPPEVSERHRHRPTSHDQNNDAIVLRLRYGARRFLLTADIEREAEAALLQRDRARLAATVLKVPHHGSRTSSTPAFLKAVHPETAVISVGARNPYRHPAPAVVRRYEAAGIRLLRTDRDGQVCFISDGTDLAFFTAEQLILQPVAGAESIVAAELDNYHRLFQRWWWKL